MTIIPNNAPCALPITFALLKAVSQSLTAAKDAVPAEPISSLPQNTNLNIDNTYPGELLARKNDSRKTNSRKTDSKETHSIQFLPTRITGLTVGSNNVTHKEETLCLT
jgi:hypothetical protein